jgi:hypothetical protein
MCIAHLVSFIVWSLTERTSRYCMQSRLRVGWQLTAVPTMPATPTNRCMYIRTTSVSAGKNALYPGASICYLGWSSDPNPQVSDNGAPIAHDLRSLLSATLHRNQQISTLRYVVGFACGSRTWALVPACDNSTSAGSQCEPCQVVHPRRRVENTD